jgi:hypothetical protein
VRETTPPLRSIRPGAAERTLRRSDVLVLDGHLGTGVVPTEDEPLLAAPLDRRRETSSVLSDPVELRLEVPGRFDDAILVAVLGGSLGTYVRRL